MPQTQTTKYVAQPCVASSPEAEVMGTGLLGLIKNLRADDVLPYLQRYGLDSIDADHWYPHQLSLDFQRAIEESHINSTDNLVAIGMAVMEKAPFPP
ncbi:MAG: hypothetical protein ABI947_12375 [Chloroflexota bacterium]